MNKKLKRFISRVCSINIALTLILSHNGSYNKVYAQGLSSENGVGIINSEKKQEIAEGVFLGSFNSNSPTTKEQKVNTITFNPKTSDVQVLTDYGSTLYSRKTLTSMMKKANEEGYTVIGGINGDFFQMDSGVPVGLMVRNGRLISANGKGWNAEGAKLEDWNAVGFKKDGSVIIGHPDITLGYRVNGSAEEKPILQFNKKRNELGVFLYTSDYSANTQTKMNSLDIVLEVTEGEIKLGQPIKGKVEKITEEVTYTPIEEGKLLLSTEVYTPGFWQLRELEVGDEVEFFMRDESGKWNDVVQAIGGYKLLLHNGQVQGGLNTSDRYPTTAIGLKDNGEVVFLQIDGRQPGWSNGIPYRDTASYLKSIGCVEGILLDGGGSSTIIAKSPLEESAKVINRPSDGKERAVGNGLLLLAKSKRDNIFAKLYASPENTMILKGASFNLEVNATDSSYYPVPTPEKLNFEVSSSLGSISSKGTFTAGNIKGIGNIKISSGEVSTTAKVQVVEEVTNIKVVPETIDIAAGKSQKLQAKAFYNDMALIGTNSEFTWSLSDPRLGTVDKEGNFTAASNISMKGTITVSYGNYSKKVEVQVGRLPVILEDFEKAVMHPESGATWSTTGAQYTSIYGEIVTKEQGQVTGGNKALKLSYDFVGSNKGIAGAYAHPINPLSPGKLPSSKEQMIKIEGYPSAIGMWVYGDGSNNWLRGQLRDGDNNPIAINFTEEYDGKTGGIDWTGWKYVQGNIPEGKVTPLYLEVPVRVMCTRDEYRNKGEIFVDEIKAIYGYEEPALPELPSTNNAAELVGNALTTKTFYDFNMALHETMKVRDENEKAILLSKLATIESLVWSKEIRAVYDKLNELIATGSGKIYDEIQIDIDNSVIATVDKYYLLGELTTWGREIVWTEDYKTAMEYYMKFFNSKDKNSAIKAETYILQIKNKYSREYLLQEFYILKKSFNIG